MMRTLLTSTALATVLSTFGQARIVFDNTAGSIYMVMNNNGGVNAPGPGNQTWLVIDHNSPVGIPNLPNLATSAGIRSESEYNRIRWATGTAVGSYFVPFNSPVGNTNIRLTYAITGAGAGAGSTVFATYNYGATVAQWDNFQYRPSDVTHVSDNMTNTSFNSGSPLAVDRFWILDTKAAGFAYTTNPSADITFTNVTAEITPGNTITAATTLAAQRFNNTNNHWADYLPTSAYTNLVATSTVVANVPSAQFFRSWTLSDLNNPLPVELTSFDGTCVDSRVELKWSTASETNNSHFEVEKSTDGVAWNMIGVVNGSGNSQETVQYSFVDSDLSSTTAYYRLKQVDNDGAANYTNLVSAGCDVVDGTELVNVWDNGTEVNLMVSSTVEGVYDVTLMDAHSKGMATLRNQQINKGITYLTIPKNSIATGVYMVRMHNATEQFSRKVVLN
ncbi:MAG: hypothetical protein IPJ76_13055 [Flavobacteriales bacterium]|nr:MAG: hypothetical protein IPJ76_13055 [Flavobacteriales bacterium]